MIVVIGAALVGIVWKVVPFSTSLPRETASPTMAKDAAEESRHSADGHSALEIAALRAERDALQYSRVQRWLDRDAARAQWLLEDELRFPTEARDLPWYLLHAMADHVVRREPIQDAVVSCDGKAVVLRRNMRDYECYDADTYERLGEYVIPDGDVKLVASGPEGRWIVLTDLSNRLDIRDGRTGERIASIDGHGIRSYAVAEFSRSGAYLATCGDDRRCRIWDTSDWRLLNEYELPLSPGTRPVWDDDESHVYALSTIRRLIKMSRGSVSRTRIKRLTPTSQPNPFCPSGRPAMLLVCDKKGQILELETEENSEGTAFPALHKTPFVLARSHDKAQYVLASQKAIALRDAMSHQTLQVFRGPEGKIDRVWFSASGKLLYCATENGELVTHRIDRVAPWREVLSADNSSDGVVLSTCGSVAMRRIRQEPIDQLEVVRLDKTPTVRTIPLVAVGHGNVCLTHDGLYYAIANRAGQITVYATDTGAPVRTFDSDTNDVTSVFLSESRDSLFLTTKPGELRQIFGKEIQSTNKLTYPSGFELQVNRSRDGRRLIVCDRAGVCTLFDIASGASCGDFATPKQVFEGVAISDDYGLVAVAARKGEIEIRDMSRGELQSTCYGARHPALTMAFSPDGRRLAAAHDNDGLILWDTRTGVELARIPTPGQTIRALAFSDDARRLVIGGGDGRLLVVGR